MSKKATTQNASRSGDDTPAPDTQKLMSLEELAAQSGVAARTIRYYQTKKLLQAPIKDKLDGRVSRYGPDHLERLRVIGELHDRGLKLPAIKNLFESGDANTRISDWLGLDQTLRGSWSSEPARLLDKADVENLIEGTPPGTLGNLEAGGLITRQGDSWLAPNPELLELTTGLIESGIAPELVLEAGEILQKHLSKAAVQLIDLFVKARNEGFGTGSDTAPLVNSLRPVAGDAARMIFGQQLERSIDHLLADTKRLPKR